MLTEKLKNLLCYYANPKTRVASCRLVLLYYECPWALQIVHGRDDLVVVPPFAFLLSRVTSSKPKLFHATAAARCGLGLPCVAFLKEAHCGQEVVRWKSVV